MLFDAAAGGLHDVIGERRAQPGDGPLLDGRGEHVKGVPVVQSASAVKESQAWMQATWRTEGGMNGYPGRLTDSRTHA